MNYASAGLNEPIVWLLKEQSKAIINKNKSRAIYLDTSRLILKLDFLLASTQYLLLVSMGLLSNIQKSLKRLPTITLGLFVDNSKRLVYWLGFVIGAIIHFIFIDMWIAVQRGYYDAMNNSKELEDRLSGARFDNE